MSHQAVSSLAKTHNIDLSSRINRKEETLCGAARGADRRPQNGMIAVGTGIPPTDCTVHRDKKGETA